MEDETDQFSNLCTDLVSLARLEAGIQRLFQNQAGDWVSVVELYRAAGIATEPIKPELVAAWLPMPSGDSEYAVVLFCDDELQWSLTAFYNIGRLSRVRPSQVTPATLPHPAR